MANLILASRYVSKQSGAQLWQVYRSENNVKSDEFNFYSPLKALRYAFLLRKRTGALIPKGIYNKLMAEVKAQRKGESAPVPGDGAQVQPEQQEQPAPEAKPEKKSRSRSNKKESK